jgi:prepilin-type N-terminal cleavage/methylation domain-containing protein/prepilin-type processing-associated H-X9-DG protein
MDRYKSIGFTLIEVLVVISIIGLIIGLMMPAINAARETGRRMQCSNHVKQISLGVQQYLDAFRKFPPGAMLEPNYPDVKSWYDPWEEAAGTSSGKHGYSWMLLILPFIEENEIYQNWNFSKSVLGNQSLAQRDIYLFYCPSRRVGIRRIDEQIMFQNWKSGGTDYGACLGRCNGWRNELSAGYAGPPKISHRFLYGSTLFEAAKTGIFAPNRQTSAAEVFDGLSKTIMIGEMQRLFPITEGTKVEKGSHTSNDGWATAGVATLFNTIDIYNPSAREGNDEDEGAPGGFNNWFFESAGSEHANGANFGFADGSIHFLNENIDTKLYSYLGSMADQQNIQLPQ